MADIKALKLAQRDLSTGSSTLLPLSLLTKAAPYLEDAEAFAELENPLELFGKRNTTVVTQEQLALLLQHTKRMIAALGEEIHRGNIAVRPCRIRQFIGCQYCSYQAICQIETVDILKNSEELLPLEQGRNLAAVVAGGRKEDRPMPTWTTEQQQAIDLRGKKFVGSGSSRLRQNGGTGGTNYSNYQR